MIAMVFLNGLTINLFFGDSNYMLDIIGYEKDIDNYLVLNSLVAIPFSLTNVIAGTVAQHFGFIPLFVVSAAAALVVIVMSPRLLGEKEIVKLHEMQDENDRIGSDQ